MKKGGGTCISPVLGVDLGKRKDIGILSGVSFGQLDKVMKYGQKLLQSCIMSGGFLGMLSLHAAL